MIEHTQRPRRRPPAPVRRALPATAVTPLSEDRCWELLASAHVGRLALIRPDARPDIFPMDYLVHDQTIYIRSAPGLKLFSIAQDPEVAFEVDGEGDGHTWSVVVQGDARRLDRDDEIEASGVLELHSTSPTGKFNYVEITPLSISGRTFRPQP